jgi:amidohydrolase
VFLPMDLNQRIAEMTASQHEKMLENRHAIHRRPCIAFHEEETVAYLCAQLDAAGISYRAPVAQNGVVARISGLHAGPTIAFRADFDGLEVQEESGVPYASEKPGLMHACGHDAHTAVMLGLARSLQENRDLIRGEVVLIFQYAEEQPPGGAAPMIADACLDGVDKIYAMHVSDELDIGTIGVHAGPYMAASDCFYAEITGPSGHGSRPSDTPDTVSAACTAILMINSIVSRFVPSGRNAVVSVCNITGGNTHNVIPAAVTFGGTVRTYEPETASLIREKLEDAIRCACQMYGVNYTYHYDFGYPVLVNHSEETETVRHAVRAYGKYQCLEIEPTPIAEDFSYYLQKCPGCFFRVGIRNQTCGAIYPLHNNRFNIDESALDIALETFLAIYLTETGQME